MEMVEQAEKRIEELGAMLSTGSEQSEVSQLNTKMCATLSEDTYTLLQQSIDICNKTKGAFGKEGM